MVGFAIIMALLASWLITALVRRYALRKGILDVPNLRSSHSVATPRGGGIAIVIVSLGAVIVLACLGLLPFRTALGLACGGAAIAIVGYLDDRHARPASLRFSVHVLAAALAVALLGGITSRTLSVFGLTGEVVELLFALVLVTWSINLFNFMDGIDGIAASEAVFITAAGAWLNWHFGGDKALSAAMLYVAAAAFGFLVWNWPPARIFMGDVGSGFLGFIIASFAIAASRSSAVPIEAWAILGGVFLVDATLTLLRRIAYGERWFEAHRSHAYQRLARRWKGHLPVTIWVILVNLLWLLPWSAMAARFPESAPKFVAAALVPLAIIAWIIGAGRSQE